jgi:hypothetical protein
VTETASAWRIVCEPVGNNPGSKPAGRSKTKGRNESGIVVYLASTGHGGKHEVQRVAFERKNSAHPDVSFEDQLERTIETARTAVAKINELLSADKELQ